MGELHGLTDQEYIDSNYCEVLHGRCWKKHPIGNTLLSLSMRLYLFPLARRMNF
jgi:hypothetical protein